MPQLGQEQSGQTLDFEAEEPLAKPEVEKAPEIQEAPELSPGVAFHLMEDGLWKPKPVPHSVLEIAIFSGYLTILGYHTTVFETPEGDMWAQKSNLDQMEQIAARVAGLENA